VGNTCHYSCVEMKMHMYILDELQQWSAMPTHGSLTKAGKVRGQTPKIQGKVRLSPVSKLRNKNNFIKRFEKRRPPGQKRPERGGRR
jgi:small subunit ribosomal protein S30e